MAMDEKANAHAPWVRGNLVVYADVLEAVDEEARRAYARDEESCGFLVGPVGEPRVLGPSTLEVAILDTSRPRRAFRRITGSALESLLPQADSKPSE